MSETDLDIVDRVVAELGGERESLIPILHALQAHYRWLPEEALRRVCATTRIRPADLAGVATFYDRFRFKPVGRRVVRVCTGTACHVKGAALVHEAMRTHLGIRDGEDTDPAGRGTVEEVACLGCCTLAPVVQAEDATYGFVGPTDVERVWRAIESGAERRESGMEEATAAAAAGPMAEIRVGLGSCCLAKSSGNLFEGIRRAVAEVGAEAAVRRVGCVGMCHRTPLVEVVLPDGARHLYAGVDPAEAGSIVRRHFRPPSLVRRLRASLARTLDGVLGGEEGDGLTRRCLEVRDPAVTAFLGKQKRIATESCGELDPLDFDQYTAGNGWRALRGCLSGGEPEAVVETVARSGLRGRGGAGFPTGRKWDLARRAAGPDKYVVCNGDEGDPGAFMDRMILESYPYRVIEGLCVAAWSIGAHEAIFYIREEYPLAVARVRAAIRCCEERGVLGPSVLGSGFALRARVVQGAGAFVCGEETALIASLEGRRGMPSLRPPYPVEHGFHGKPTLVNNVETLATVPWILRHGAEAFAALGTARSKGTKVFSLAGKVVRGGLIEVPMGTTIREIVEEIGGGVAGGRTWKAVQVGGPSGGCIPAELADTPIDYEALLEAGAMMGSGGLVVLDDRDCMVDMARYFLRFTQAQSCGKCTFCRVGTRRMLDVLERLCAGRGRAEDLSALESLGHSVSGASLCGLGRTAPNPVLTTLKYFRAEFEAHLAGRCPAGRCRELIRYSVRERCTGCTRCSRACPADAIPYTPYRRHEIDTTKCTRCDACRQVCPEDAIEVR